MTDTTASASPYEGFESVYVIPDEVLVSDAIENVKAAWKIPGKPIEGRVLTFIDLRRKETTSVLVTTEGYEELVQLLIGAMVATAIERGEQEEVERMLHHVLDVLHPGVKDAGQEALDTGD